MIKTMHDYCCGKKGASEPFKKRNWNVITIDINPKIKPDVVADIRYNPIKESADFIWFSPPCDEFAREFMPWSKKGIEPSVELALACKKIIKEKIKLNPSLYWAVENVKGAIKYFEPIFGKYRARFGPFYIWGNIPKIDFGNIKMKKKSSYGSKKKEERAKVPDIVGETIIDVIENRLCLFD